MRYLYAARLLCVTWWLRRSVAESRRSSSSCREPNPGSYRAYKEAVRGVQQPSHSRLFPSLCVSFRFSLPLSRLEHKLARHMEASVPPFLSPLMLCPYFADSNKKSISFFYLFLFLSSSIAFHYYYTNFSFLLGNRMATILL